MRLNLKRGVSIGTYQVAFVTAFFFVSAAIALQCYTCPYKSYNLSTSNRQTCVKGYKGILQVCDDDMKDPRCVSSITENHPNLALRGCWSAEKLPSDIECGVMKFYDTIQKIGRGTGDICVCNSDGCIPDKESSKSFSNWVHNPRFHLKIVVIVIFLLALN